MGSGKGRQRRARHVLPAGTKRNTPWEGFVSKAEISEQNVFDYYLGSGNRPRDGDAPEKNHERYAQVFQELFLDACEIGVVAPPAGVLPEDVVIKPQGISFRDFRHTVHVQVVQRGQVKSDVRMKVFLPLCKMADINILDSLVKNLVLGVPSNIPPAATKYKT